VDESLRLGRIEFIPHIGCRAVGLIIKEM